MSIDQEQFYEIFFEESREHVDELEKLVLGIDLDAPDREAIQAIFRAAHSLKGESAALDFTEITSFTHVLETFLDRVRAGDTRLDATGVDLVMRSVDLVRAMVDAREAGAPLPEAASGALQAQIRALLDQTGDVPQAVPGAEGAPEQFPADVAADRTAGGRGAPGERPVDLEHSIRVPVDKIDGLMNLVGELVITQGMLAELREKPHLAGETLLMRGLDELEHHTRDLQDRVMRIRMFPVRLVFERFPRLVHDLCRSLQKKVRLELSGESTELDKSVIEKLGDPLIHLVRNAIDHGIETPDARAAAGKPRTATLRVGAWQEQGRVIIEVLDDGQGLNAEKILAKAVEEGLAEPGARLTDEQIHALIFLPGFSTAASVSAISGRGVGMDVVRSNIESMHGTLSVRSTPGQGAVFRIDLPLTLAILDGQMVHVGDERYVVPLMSIIESIQVRTAELHRLVSGCNVYPLRGEYIPVIDLARLFGVTPAEGHRVTVLVVVVEHERERVGIVVDDLGVQQQVVSKSVEENYQPVDGVGGATICGDGSVALILDVPDLIRMAGVQQARAEIRSLDPAGGEIDPRPHAREG